MPLKKIVEIASIGVPASFHVVRRVTVDMQLKQSIVEVASFYNREVAQQGAQSIGIATVQIEGVPGKGEDLTRFAERVLIEQPPERIDSCALPPNRFVFTEAEVVPDVTSS
ncbi:MULTISPECIES: hypothetical protein [unclassified Caballeronia]|uniref:hypothetical protein n=1 Tax=unclassified Caballeronia TaxID=2646786 RepID=UPI002859B8D5|nr:MULTISPECIES: hypothetical protein [unclassified Caballeronia]MDR5777792.1 hypothetical protein [Caballeronia sp. LZ002]MDR5853224.1 hypothetical protein [Caballeronia sp. LZ003]